VVKAHEGALEIQKAQVSEAAKGVSKAKETKKRKKEQAKAAKKKKPKTGPKEAEEEVTITPAMREAYKKEKKSKTTKKTQLQETPEQYKHTEKLLANLAQYRAPYLVYWNPEDLLDPPDATAIRGRDPEHVKQVATAMWTAKECGTKKPWLVFQFEVSHTCKFSR
jgi:hypothetical protein